jgi:hypothetical protein
MSDLQQLNTSMVGHNILGKSTKSDKPADSNKDGGVLGDVKGWLNGKKDEAKDKINDVTGEIADKIIKKIGISEWYSLHIMDTCHGSFQPNGSVPNAGLNITNCTSSSPSRKSA